MKFKPFTLQSKYFAARVPHETLTSNRYGRNYILFWDIRG
jgi:hypothetical protein